MEQKKFLILGHPRSGTEFMATLFQKFSYDIGHEKMGKDGISSWMMAVDDYKIYGDPNLHRKNFSFDYTLMNIRHPIDIVSSIFHTGVCESLAYRIKHLNLDGLNDMETSVKSVLGWYKLIELQRPILKVCIDKSPEDKLYYFLRRFEHPEILPIKKVTEKINSRNHPDITFSTIKKNCNREIVMELVNFCKLYGYSLNK